MKTATTSDGRSFALVPPTETGLVPCDGEAHSNPYIDNCLTCAPRWGHMMSYARTLPSACLPGLAVPYVDSDVAAFEIDGGFELASMTSGSTTFFAWIRK